MLHQGVGLLVVDVVTSRQANLHDELIDLLRQGTALRISERSPLYAVSYRPSRPTVDVEQAEICCYDLALDGALPAVPLALQDGPTLALNLESAYMEARGRSRL